NTCEAKRSIHELNNYKLKILNTCEAKRSIHELNNYKLKFTLFVDVRSIIGLICMLFSLAK
ncbi:MAG TPA: hypothetical protein PLO32_00505, partial [Chitinophagales bacterium]|nr:hypothetical protein [Chitinophagales bacterium]